MLTAEIVDKISNMAKEISLAQKYSDRETILFEQGMFCGAGIMLANIKGDKKND